MRLLVVEDDPKMAALLQRGLTSRGYLVDQAARGDDAVAAAAAVDYDAIVLDLMLPGMDGVQAIAAMRKRGVWAPVLMLTARDAIGDRVASLDAGADDYLRKPFAFAELVARLRALARRANRPRPTVLEAAGLRLDPAERSVTRDGVPIALGPREFLLLETLLRNAGQVLTRDQLLHHCWDDVLDGYPSNVVDAAVRRLRQHIDEPFATDSIEAVRGVGYRLRRDPRNA